MISQSGQVVIPAGQTSADIQLTALKDAVNEKRETVKIVLTPGQGYKLPRKGGKSVTLKIVNVPGP